MSGLRDPRRYRTEAAHFLELAEYFADDIRLRDSYLALAVAYERLADVIEGVDRFESTPRR
jgi:hypothetical protein